MRDCSRNLGRSRVGWTLCVSILLAVAFLVAPPMGTDLAAQLARADFFAAYGRQPIDFGWYGGVNQFGYSLMTAPLGAALGVRVVGAVAATVSALALLRLLVQGAATRPLLGAVIGAIVFVGNLASGRITFAVGLAVGLVALCVAGAGSIGAGAVGTGSAKGGRRWVCVSGVAVLAAVATWASPVAGLFVGLAGAALLLASPFPGRLRQWRPSTRWPEAAALCLAPAVALAPMALLFGNGGRQPFTVESMWAHVALAVLVVLVVPGGQRSIRIGAVLTVVLLLAAYVLPSPIGSNALRLPLLFTMPILAAFVTVSGRWLALLLAVVVWWQPPIVTGDVIRAGSPETRAAFYRPLVDELVARSPGRVEVVPLRDHWESVYVAARVPLARGWERQVDTDRNALFYSSGLDSSRYLAWLHANAVSYVAMAPDSIPDRYARDEAALVMAGVTGLREVWHDGTWRLFEVDDAVPLVSPPARLVTADRGGVTVESPSPGDVLVRVRWSRWLTLQGSVGCLAPGLDGWTAVRGIGTGRYRVTSGLSPGPHC